MKCACIQDTSELILQDPSSNPGLNPGSNPGSDPSLDPGSDPCSDPGSNPGSDPGSDPGSKFRYPLLFLPLTFTRKFHQCQLLSYTLLVFHCLINPTAINRRR